MGLLIPWEHKRTTDCGCLPPAGGSDQQRGAHRHHSGPDGDSHRCDHQLQPLWPGPLHPGGQGKIRGGLFQRLQHGQLQRVLPPGRPVHRGLCHQRQPGQDRGAAIYQRQAPGGAVHPRGRGRQHPRHDGCESRRGNRQNRHIHRPGPPDRREHSGRVQPPVLQRRGGGRYALRHLHPSDGPAALADGAGDRRHHRGGDLSDLRIQPDLHQQRGDAGGGGVRGRQAHFLRQLRHPDQQQILRRAGPAGGQHQQHVPEDQSKRKNTDGIHLLRVPRAAHPADGHQRLGRDAAGR